MNPRWIEHRCLKREHVGGSERREERDEDGEGGHLRKTEERHRSIFLSMHLEEGDSRTTHPRLHEIEGGQFRGYKADERTILRPISGPILSKRENKLAIIPRDHLLTPESLLPIEICKRDIVYIHCVENYRSFW